MGIMDKNIRWAIIGCGNVCEVKSGPAFSIVPHSSLVAVMRRNFELAKDYALRHGVPSYYDNVEEVLARKDIHAVYIATPTISHEPYTLQALEAGKAVYVEKPVALDVSACERMIEAQRKTKLPVVVAHYRRALPLFQTIKMLLEEQEIGDIISIDLRLWNTPPSEISKDKNWRIDPALSGGGLFHDLAPHQLDILYWLFRDMHDVVVKTENVQKAYNAPDQVNLEATFNTSIKFSGEWRFYVDQQNVEEWTIIQGKKGRIIFSFFDPTWLKVETNQTKQLNFERWKHIQQPMIEQVVKHFRNEVSNPCSLEDARATLRIMDLAK
jgi:1,5-anhydro-D-fructose reductase (1,5-anhydro-D-mannitol-forming)